MSVHECLVGALLALASGKAERRQVHPLGEHQSKTSHRFHRCAQIRRVWHPAIPTLPTKLSSHKTLRNLTICGHL